MTRQSLPLPFSPSPPLMHSFSIKATTLKKTKQKCCQCELENKNSTTSPEPHQPIREGVGDTTCPCEGPGVGCTPLSQDRGLKKRASVRRKRAQCEPSSSPSALPGSLTHVTQPALLTRGSLNIVKSPHRRGEGKGGKMGERENRRKTLPWTSVFIKSRGTSPRQHLPCESCCSWDPRFPMTRA